MHDGEVCGKVVYGECDYPLEFTILAKTMVLLGMTSSVPSHNSLAELYPKLAVEFNVARNGTTPDKVTGKSNKKMWWTCSIGHDYEAPISRRATYGSGCAYCKNVKVLEGYNDLSTVNPELAKQLDVSKSGFAATEVMGKSSKRAWWKCSEGHSWEAVISSRSNGRGCPSCSGWSVTAESSLATKHPELVSLIDMGKNQVDPFKISPNSHKKLWWKCEQGHSYEQIIGNKTRQNDGCPYCSGRYASDGNNLAEAHPELAKEFNADRNGFTAYDITPGSKKMVWWKCTREHEWKISPSGRNRTSGSKRKTNQVFRIGKGKDSGCPFCAGVKVLVGFNDLATTNPTIASQLDVEKTGFTAKDVTAGSTRYAYWKCAYSHSWKAVVSSRGKRNSGCPECSVANSSMIEVAFRKSLLALPSWNVYDESNTKLLLMDNSKPKKMMVDILASVNGKKLVVEYDGYYYHSGTFRDDKETCFTRDAKKTSLLLANDYYVVRIREKNFNGVLDFLDLSHPRLFQIHHDYKGQKLDHTASIKDTIDQIDKWIKSV